MSDRRVRLEGPVNFRHLGGYRVAGGGTTRPGVVYRSDSLHRMTTSDTARVTSELRVRTAIDLRSRPERERVGHVDDVESLAVHHLPTFDETLQRGAGEPERATTAEMSVSEAYASMLRIGGPRFARAIEVIASADGRPVVFFCMAGKDRTGILAALVLGLVGVVEDDIVDDYARTREVIGDVRANILEEMPEMRERWKRMPRDILGSTPDSMAGTIGHIDDHWGGFESYATAHGVQAETIDRLRAALVES